MEAKAGLLGLEIKYPQAKFPPLEADINLKAELTKDLDPKENPAAEREWESFLDKEKSLIKKMEFARLQMRMSSLILPLVLVITLFGISAPSVETTLDQVKGIVRNFTRGSRIEVVSGKFNEGTPGVYSLGKVPHQIALAEENMLHIYIDTGNDENSPVITLKKSQKASAEGPQKDLNQSGTLKQNSSKEETQTFLATPVRNKTSGLKEPGLFELSFSSQDSSDLFLPSLFGEKKLASFIVYSSPKPKVQLNIAIENPNDPWHDEDPLPLSIQVDAFHPLQLVKLKIVASGKPSFETVANILKEDQIRYDGMYPLDIRPYVDSDFTELEISALAEDRGVPKPLSGESRVIKIKVASAYGRYQMTLQKLRKVKQSLDEALNSSSFKVSPESLNTFKDAEKVSESSPYFDGLDRMNLQRMGEDLSKALESKSPTKLVVLNGEISEFLFEHESLDDRERDRDFFVVARTLSRVLELEEASRPVKASFVGERIVNFLDTRAERWKKRVERLPAGLAPKNSQTIIGKRSFQKSIQNVVSLAESTGSAAEKNEKLNSSLKLLATTVSEYRNWIDALEKAEDELRKNQQEDKQKAMANAANKLRELQKNQGDISSKLDRADARENEIAKDWNATASSQQKNKKETEALVGEMATMSPEGAKRLQAAADAMEETMTSGSTKNFSTAESMSDMAGRLLSQSQKSLQDNKEDQGRQPRKRRQTSGDNSFGTQVSGNVDLKREYSVDKKYREEILDSINETPAAKEDLPLLNNYLRKTVR
jgi:hypothetical protein